MSFDPESELGWSEYRHVLLLEDDLELGAIIKLVLEINSKNRVTVVHRGVEGVEQVLKRRFDAVVCDMVMPTMPGDMFYLAVQKLDPGLCPHFVFVTAYGSDPHIARFLAQINGKVLHKPLHTDELINSVAEALRERELDHV